MGRRRKETVEFRFYDVPEDCHVLALLGEKWIRVYGQDVSSLHFHNLMEIGYCRFGNGTLILDQKRCRYENSMLSIIPANYPHTTVSAKKEDYWEYLFFDPEYFIKQMYPVNLKKQREMLDIVTRNADLLRESEYPSITMNVKNIMEELRNKKMCYENQVELLIKVLLIDIIRIHSEYKEDLDNNIDLCSLTQVVPAIDYVDANYACNIKVKELAFICGMSETHFRRVFEENINMPPMEYVNLVRIQKACELMTKTDYSMDVIAAECGYQTTSTFNRNFKKYLDTSPYQWKINPNNYTSKLKNFKISALKGW